MNKELEEAIKSLEKVSNAKSGYSYEIALFDFGEHAEAVLKELERLQEENKQYKNSYEIAERIAINTPFSCENIYDIAKMVFSFKTLEKDYISKHKIREIIENLTRELNDNSKNIGDCVIHQEEIMKLENQIEILKELLEGK